MTDDSQMEYKIILENNYIDWNQSQVKIFTMTIYKKQSTFLSIFKKLFKLLETIIMWYSTWQESIYMNLFIYSISNIVDNILKNIVFKQRYKIYTNQKVVW